MKYIRDTVLEVVHAVTPITLIIVLMQVALVRLPMETFINFLVGVLMVGLGLILFFIGVHIGVLPIDEMLGSKLPRTGKVTTDPMTVPFILTLGVGVAAVLGGKRNASENAFGLVGISSVGPVPALLLLGVIYG